MVNIQQRRLVYDCRATSREKESGTINCELLVHQRGSWVNLPIHNADSTIQHGRQLITGYVESQTNQKFRALLTYNHTNMKRTALWHLDQDVVCSMFIDGRKKPVCEHTIRKNAAENPVDLTGLASANGLPFANVPSEKAICFSWKEREDNSEPINHSPRYGTSIDDHSCLSFKLSPCDIRRVARDSSGKAAFPTSDPSLTPSKRDKDFEPLHGTHRRLSHYIHIGETEASSTTEDELVPDFVTSGPSFVEFRFYYKSRGTLGSSSLVKDNLLNNLIAELLETLELTDSNERPRRGLAASRSMPDLAAIPSPTPSQPLQQLFQRPVQSPSARTIQTIPKSKLKSKLRQSLPSAARVRRVIQSPELPTPTPSSSACKKPPMSSVKTRLPTPWNPRSPAATQSPPRQKRPAPTPSASPDRPSKRPALPQQQQAQAKQASEQVDTASLPSPPASPVQGEHSDTSLPSLEQIIRQRTASATHLSNKSRPFASGSEQQKVPAPHESSSLQRSIARNSPTRAQASASTTTPTKKVVSARPPLIPGPHNIPLRKEPMPSARAPALRPETTPSSSLPTSTSSTQQLDRDLHPPLPTPAASGEPTTSATSIPTIALPQAGPSTPRPSAPPSGTAAPAAKREDTSPKVKTSTSPFKTPTVKKEAAQIIDLTLDSENEGEAEEEGKRKEEQEEKKDVKINTTESKTPEKNFKEMAERKDASAHATDLLTELDIYDVGNIQALVSVGFKSTETFVKRLPKLDASYRRSILEELAKEMGRLDFGVLRAYLTQQGLDLDD